MTSVLNTLPWDQCASRGNRRDFDLHMLPKIEGVAHFIKILPDVWRVAEESWPVGVEGKVVRVCMRRDYRKQVRCVSLKRIVAQQELLLVPSNPGEVEGISSQRKPNLRWLLGPCPPNQSLMEPQALTRIYSLSHAAPGYLFSNQVHERGSA